TFSAPVPASFTSSTDATLIANMEPGTVTMEGVSFPIPAVTVDNSFTDMDRWV
ncbi:hypothetical protein KIPB_009920, partial [Kipferlia bialata]